MKTRFIAVSTLLLFLLALAWNGLVHMVILKAGNAAVAFLHRPGLNDKMWISLPVTAGIVFLFTVSYLKWRKAGTICESMLHSLFFACLMIIAVDLNQYVLYAIPFSLIAKWAVFGLAEFILYGLVLCFLAKKLLTP